MWSVCRVLRRYLTPEEYMPTVVIGVRGGGGGLQPPWIFSNSHFRAKKHVIFGQNHLIFGQAMEKIFGQLTSAPLNDTGPVRLWLLCTRVVINDIPVWLEIL